MSTAPPALPSEQKEQSGPLYGPWPLPTTGERSWPGPGRPASAATLAALLVAAVIGAFSVPLDRAGVGWLVVAIAGTAALVVARVVPDPPAVPPLVQRPAPGLARDRFLWTAGTIALLAVGTFRAADWLFALCVVTATVTTVLAISTGRSLRSVVVAYLIVPVAALRGLAWLRAGLTRLGSRGSTSVPARAAGTAVVSIVLLTVFGSLFVSADAAFARFFEALMPEFRVDAVLRWVFVGGLTLTLLGAAAFLRAAPPTAGGLDRTEGRKVGRLEWAVPLGLLTLLFAAFVAVQLTVLFGGSRHVVQTDGLTYAEYARNGFWQLCAVTALTLVVLAGAARWAPRTSRTDRLVLRYVLGALTVLTFVIVASALHRMSVYTDTYGLTRLRLLVAACEVWFGLILVMVLIAGIRIRAPWLPRVALAAGVLALLGLAAADPDALIAENHVQRYERTQRIDTGYLGSLSPDAVPALAEMADGEKRACLLWTIGEATAPDEGWREWNLAREAARDLIARYQPGDTRKCAAEIYRD